MKKVYVDNSATSFPKAPGVADEMKKFLDEVGCNVNRGAYESSYETSMEILNTRKLLCELFHADDPRNVVFTPGLTHSLNMILLGYLKAGDHVLVTSMEHNSVMRPLSELTKASLTYDVVQCNSDGALDAEDVAKQLNAKTKAVIMTHASNICGTVLPIREVSEICRNHNIKLIVDSAQTAGSLDVDMSFIDALAFTCHKGLLAAQGLGGFIVRSDFAAEMRPLITGGTGSLSHEITQPDFLPDKFESGTMNIPAIIGLKSSLKYIRSTGIDAILSKEMKLTEQFISEINSINDVDIIGKKDITDRTAVVSLDFKGRDNAEIAAALDSDYGIMTRCGLHCAPNAHKTTGTFPRGTVRFSFGHFNTPDEVEYIVYAIAKITGGG